MAGRIQLRRTRGWRLPPGAVVVDRRTRWGNPYAVDDRMSAERAVALYRADLLADLTIEPDLLRPLAGKNLACWCRPGAPCHADVLVDLANRGAD